MQDDIFLWLSNHPLFENFYSQLGNNKFADIEELVADFTLFCKDAKIPNFDSELWFKILNEKMTSYESDIRLDCYKIGENGEKHVLSYEKFDPCLQLDESDLKDFEKEWETRKTDNKKYTDEQSHRYKTFKEFRLYHVYTYTEDFLEKYEHAAHPLIQTTIGKALLSSGDNRGIGYIFNALKRSVIMPNPYWHNKYAIRGYVESIWEVLRSCNLGGISGGEKGVGDDHLYNKLLRLLFLYMSRCIALAPDDITTADMYSNRAELFYHFPSKMQVLFQEHGFPAIIPDLQFSSDKFLAFKTASIVCPELISAFYHQCLYDAFKMYRYGDLSYFSIDVGYTEIEDASFMDIVNRGKMRSRIVAQQIFDEDSVGNVYLTKMQVAKLFELVLSSGIDLDKDLKDLMVHKCK